MKKISLMFAALAATLSFSSCSETWDDNPTLNTFEGEPVVNFLNEPVMKNMAIMLTEENAADALHLTCSQPDYGYAATVKYTVQMAMKADDLNAAPDENGKVPYVSLGTSFTDCAQINPVISEVAAGMCTLLGIESVDQIDETKYHQVFMRLRACIMNENSEEVPNTTILSNIVSFNQICVGYLAIIVPGLPTGIYLRGGMNGWLNEASDDVMKAWEFVTTSEANVFEIDFCSIPKNTTFKIADKDWGDVNLGDKDGASPEFGVPFELGVNSNDMSFKEDFTGRVQLSVKGKLDRTGKYTVLFELAEPDTPGQASGIYLVGEFSEWKFQPANEFMTTDFKNVWALENITLPAGKFKVATSDWSTINLGENGDAFTVGVPYALEPGTGDIYLEDPFVGSATLRVKGGKYYITLSEAEE